MKYGSCGVPTRYMFDIDPPAAHSSFPADHASHLLTVHRIMNAERGTHGGPPTLLHGSPGSGRQLDHHHLPPPYRWGPEGGGDLIDLVDPFFLPDTLPSPFPLRFSRTRGRRTQPAFPPHPHPHPSIALYCILAPPNLSSQYFFVLRKPDAI